MSILNILRSNLRKATSKWNNGRGGVLNVHTGASGEEFFERVGEKWEEETGLGGCLLFRLLRLLTLLFLSMLLLGVGLFAVSFSEITVLY